MTSPRAFLRSLAAASCVAALAACGPEASPKPAAAAPGGGLPAASATSTSSATPAPTAAPRAPSGPVGAIALRSDPAPALVFFDGRFVGQTSTHGPLEITAAPGAHQIRLSESGRLDAIFEATLETGVVRDVTATLPAPEAPWTAPDVVKIAVGQPVRTKLGAKPIVYEADEAFVPRRMLVVTAGSPTFAVEGPDGRSVDVRPLTPRPAGTPGNAFFVYEGATPGRYRISVAGKPGRASWRFVQALSDLAETDDPKSKGRRKPPVPPSAR